MQQNETWARARWRTAQATSRLIVIFVVLASIGCLGGCAHDVHVRYPDESGGDRGVVAVLLDDASDVTLAVNGLLLVNDAHTKRIEISNLPVGYAELAVSAGGSAQQTKVWVTAEHPTALPMGAPTPPSPGIVASLLSTAVSVAVYVLTRQLFL